MIASQDWSQISVFQLVIWFHRASWRTRSVINNISKSARVLASYLVFSFGKRMYSGHGLLQENPSVNVYCKRASTQASAITKESESRGFTYLGSLCCVL
jgi:hypothetical protein